MSQSSGPKRDVITVVSVSGFAKLVYAVRASKVKTYPNPDFYDLVRETQAITKRDRRAERNRNLT